MRAFSVLCVMALHHGPSAGCGGRLRRSLGVEGAQAAPAAAITDTAGLEEAPGPALDTLTRVLGSCVLENEVSCHFKEIN